MTYNLVRGWAPLRGVLADREKFIDLPIAELYDLRTDPSENQNGAAQKPQRLSVLSNILRTFNTAPPQRPGQESAEAVAALRSLGYVSGSTPAKASYTENDDPKRLVEIDRDLHAATDLFENGKRDEAMALLQKALERRPDTADAYISLAHAYWEAGQPREAIETLERALRSGAPDRDVRIRLGLYLAESGENPTRAIALLEHMGADDVEALNGLGVAFGDAGRFDDAIQTFMRVIALDPTNGIAYQNLGSMTLRKALAAKARIRPPERTSTGRNLHAPGDRGGPVAAGRAHDDGCHPGVEWPEEGGDRELEASRGAGWPAVQRDVQLMVGAGGRRIPGRGGQIRAAVRQHCPARVLQVGHRTCRAVSEVRTWEVRRPVGVRPVSDRGQTGV